MRNTLLTGMLAAALCGGCRSESGSPTASTLLQPDRAAIDPVDGVERIHTGTLVRAGSRSGAGAGWRLDRALEDGGPIECDVGDQIEQAKIFEGKRCRVVGVIVTAAALNGGPARRVLRAKYVQPHDLERYQSGR